MCPKLDLRSPAPGGTHVEWGMWLQPSLVTPTVVQQEARHARPLTEPPLAYPRTTYLNISPGLEPVSQAGMPRLLLADSHLGDV